MDLTEEQDNTREIFEEEKRKNITNFNPHQ
jgi:hypothetical protein